MSNEIIDILVIDDERDIGELIKDIMQEDLGLNTKYVLNSRDALKFLKLYSPRLIILDVWLEGSDEGLSLLKIFQDSYREIPVIVISGHGNIDTAVKAIKMGAYNYLEKPFKAETIKLMVKRTIQNLQLKIQHYQIKQRLDLSSIVGKSKKIEIIRDAIKNNSEKNQLVLIKGGIGSGKRKIARIIHNYSNLSENPFYTVTGAKKDDFLNSDDKYLPAKYKGATVFIPDVLKLSAEMQKNLLRRITQLINQKHEFFRYKIICAVSENLEDFVQAGKFHPDLSKRLSSWQISIPDLKDRKQDIEEIIDHISTEFCQNIGLPKFNITKSRLESLVAYDWPGNVAELKLKIHQIMLYNLLGINKKYSDKSKNNKNFIDYFAKEDLKKAKNIFEKEYIKMQINRFEGNISKTADFIGMSRPALHKKISDLKI